MIARNARRAAAVLAGALAIAAPRPAAAQSSLPGVLGVIATGALDTGFFVYDGVMLSRGKLVPRDVAISETLLGGVQVAVWEGFQIWSVTLRDPEREAAVGWLVAPAAVADAITIHGAWSLGVTTARPAPVLGVSIAAGIDSALTMSALAHAGTGRLAGRWLGVATVAASAPSAAVAAYEISVDPAHRGEWAALSAWSGVLTAYGIAAAVVDMKPKPIEEPAPPPRREPPGPVEIPAESLRFGPMPVARGMGVGFSGVWF